MRLTTRCSAVERLAAAGEALAALALLRPHRALRDMHAQASVHANTPPRGTVVVAAVNAALDRGRRGMPPVARLLANAGCTQLA